MTPDDELGMGLGAAVDSGVVVSAYDYNGKTPVPDDRDLEDDYSEGSFA